MAEIIVIDPANVTVDGEHAGSVTDVLSNYAHVDGIKGAILDGLQNQAQAEKDALGAQVAELKTALAEARAQIAALGGTELAQQLAREARKKELLAARAAMAAELATLQTEATANG